MQYSLRRRTFRGASVTCERMTDNDPKLPVALLLNRTQICCMQGLIL